MESVVLHVRRSNGDRHFYFVENPESQEELETLVRVVEDVEKVTLASQEEIEPRYARWTALTDYSIKINGQWWGMADVEEFAAFMLRRGQ